MWYFLCVFSAFQHKKCCNEDFDELFGCAALNLWSKYTTFVYTNLPLAGFEKGSLEPQACVLPIEPPLLVALSSFVFGDHPKDWAISILRIKMLKLSKADSYTCFLSSPGIAHVLIFNLDLFLFAIQRCNYFKQNK